ncbi:hypothetical protein AX16_007958 [Volvariella volvacea WC 439]|nr:hypothetical protein AX16_007958 [Volvariella volvacea WC 439]
MPSSSKKVVRFVNEDEYEYYSPVPSPPSPASSTSTLSSVDIITPPTHSLPLPPDPRLLQMPVSIHLLLGLSSSPPLQLNVSIDPALSSPAISPTVLNQPATEPPLPSLFLRCRHLPWIITIQASPKRAPFVTILDVITGIYQALQQPASKEEYLREDQNRQLAIARAFEARTAHNPQEYRRGLKRIDFLDGRHRFIGISKTDEGPQVWKLSVA